MGQNGEDIKLSPAAKKVLDLSIECKRHESLNVVGTFLTHFQKYAKNPSLKLLIHRKNRTEALVTLRWRDLLEIIKKTLPSGDPK